METERWNKVQSIFEKALDVKSARQKDFVKEACGDDTEIYSEVISLLEEDLDAHSMLDGLAVDAVDLPTESNIGKQIGPYRISREIGAGGMGAVYLAERTEGEFEQQVAIKLIKRGMDSDQILKRFMAERQILARLQHPNIARLLDGGLTDDGLPYFTLEFVEGEPIDSYCDRKKLSIDERLNLFRSVCLAVQYAHQSLIVHRDLKPSNILVTEDGTVKLLDFGIAKALSEESDEPSAALTRTGLRVMTPHYAAPEQVRGEPITTATDVYALGVILYELITGKSPYWVDPGSSIEMERAICGTQPDKPSDAVTKKPTTSKELDIAESLEKISEDRSTKQDRLKRTLAGDLDNICLLALRKEPERRYRSAEQFFEDIGRYLKGLPVRARPDTFGYRTQKFIQRNQLRLALIGAVFLVIIALIAFYTARLEAERDRAQLETQKAEQVSDFLTGLFEVSDPGQSKGGTITARELLDRGAAQIETELTEQPAVQAQMLHVIGGVYGSLGLYAEADTLLGRALALRRDLHGEEHPDVAKTLTALGILYEQVGRYEDAATMHRSALAVLRVHSDDEPIALASSLHSLAHAQMRLEQLDEAERLIREALAIKRTLLGDKNPDVAYSLNILGDVHTYQGRYDEAEVIHLEALAMRRELLGDDHIDVAVSLHNLAATLLSMERYEEAEVMYREILPLWKKIYGTETFEVANTLSQLSFVVGRQGRYEESEAMHREAMATFRRVFGDEHPRIASGLARHARLLAEQGRYPEAEATYGEALAMWRRQLGNEHPSVMTALARVGTYVWKQGRYAEAERLLLEGHQLCESLRGSDDPCIELARSSLFDLYEAWGRLHKAQIYATR